MPKVFWPHQEKAFAYAAPRDRIALFMEMRCGKTPVAIRWAQTKVPIGGIVLVLGPVEVLDDWVTELADEGETRVINAANLAAKDRLELIDEISVYDGGKRLWVLFNYEALRASRTTFLDGVKRWDAIICDESTKIRNPKAKTTKIVTKLGQRIRYRAILSGLPNPEGPEDYFSQFVFLNGQFCGWDNYWLWREKTFFQPLGGQAWQWMPRADTRTKIKTEVAREAFRMTRKRAKIGGDLLFNRWVVEPTPEQVKATKSIMRNFELDGLSTKWATVRDVWLARVAGGYLPEEGPPDADGEPTTVYRQVSDRKHLLLRDRLQSDLRGEPVVVWFRFNRELFDALKVLQDAGIRAAAITGATPRAERLRIRADFKAGKFDVFLIQLATGLYGLNLSRASTAIYFSNRYDLEVRSQSQDRIIHGMKTTASHAIDLVTRGSLDEAVSKALRKKWQNQKSFDMALAAQWVDDFRRMYGGKGR